jgi:LmbE family N-acetylglucosaminyl deacetylase
MLNRVQHDVTQPRRRKLDVVSVMAHQDDELMCLGTMLSRGLVKPYSVLP